MNRDSPEKGAYGDGSPVAAFATPLSESALAVIRCSGGGALELAAPFFSRPEKLKTAAGHSIVHGWIRHEGEKIDEVLISVYRQPKSYTGEEGMDISCHGGIAAARGVMKILRKAGFRDALPGEFTFRAFMNGRLDLTRAESVMEMVSAKTGAGLRGAALRLSGALETEIRSLRDKLVEILAETEIYLDYSEDEFVPGGAEDPGGTAGEESGGRMPGRALAEEVLARLGALSASFKRERLYQDGALAVIAGKPNAGKSSLFNRLIGEDRAIVAETPGTTRDFIEAWISVEGIPVRLADTAGIRDGLSPDSVENTGMDRSRALMAEADLVLCVTDGTEKYEHEKDFPFKGENPRLFIWNKADLPSCPAPPRGFLPVSAVTGSGIPELCGAIAAALEKTAEGPRAPGGPGETGVAPGTQRQKELMDQAAAPLAEALELADRGEPLDIIAPLLRESANALGEITGEVSSADILEKMFSKFCVGK